MSTATRGKIWGEKADRSEDIAAFRALADSNVHLVTWELCELSESLGRPPIRLDVARRWLANYPGPWADAMPERRAASAKLAATVYGVSQDPKPKNVLTSAQVKERVVGFTSPHGPEPEKRPVIDPHDLRAACRRYLAEHRKVRRGWQALTVEQYQAVNVAAQARSQANYNAGRAYRDRKAVGA